MNSDQRPFRRWFWVRVPVDPKCNSRFRASREASLRAAPRPIKVHEQKRKTGVCEWGQKRQNGHENLEKQQQTATYLNAWKRGGTKVEIATAFGSQRDSQKREKIAADFSKRKSKRKSSFSRQSEKVRLNSRN